MSSVRARQRTTNLATSLRQSAARVPGSPAIVRGETRRTWSELDVRVDALARALLDRGIGPGSVVLLHSPNCLDYLTVLLATWRVGAVITPTNAKLPPTDVSALAAVARPDLSVIHQDAAGHGAALAPTPVWTIGDGGGARFGEETVGTLIEKHRGARVDDAAVRVGDPAWYFFTSGSSGRPKAAVLTHDQMAFVVTNHLCDLMPDLRSEDATLVLAPLSHGAGVHALTHVARGAAIVLMPGESLDVAEAWRAIAGDRVSTLFTVPTILMKLVEAASSADRSSLRYVIYAGAPIASSHRRRARETLGRILVQYYGLAEVTGNITVLPTWMHDDTPECDGIGTAGFARTGMTVSIQDEAGRELPAGERGEICVCGPAVFAGYLADPDADARSFRDGWFRTGDLGLLDDAGLLYITGRASDMYISGGSNIDPRAVEEKILAHPAVRQVGVVGAPDAVWGEVGFALCVLDPAAEVTEAEMLLWCRAAMARYAVPKLVRFVDSLPTSAYGKVTTPLLRARFTELGLWPEADPR